MAWWKLCFGKISQATFKIFVKMSEIRVSGRDLGMISGRPAKTPLQLFICGVIEVWGGNGKKVVWISLKAWAVGLDDVYAERMNEKKDWKWR